jgi:peptidoglycan/xylan/chitin deacetylase (PgdA/CDA1 family)
MTRIRIATAAAVLAVGLFLLGCGIQAGGDTTWHAAPQAGGSGGGQGTGTLASPSSSASGSSSPSSAPGVANTTGTTGVALTFDDGPDPTYTPAILALLKKHGVKATFCLIGINVQAHPDLVRAIVADGHTLCNHTWKHDLKLGTKGADAIRADLQRTQDAILAAAPGATVKYFRHPGGMWTPTAVKVANDMGMACAGWEVDTNDWNTAKWAAGTTMKQHVLSVLRTQVKAGAIVLAHDAGGDRSGTLAAYEVALPELVAKFKLSALP